MKTKERKQYTAEFKAQAVALMATGKPIGQLAAVQSPMVVIARALR
jgi:transposase-like protein